MTRKQFDYSDLRELNFAQHSWGAVMTARCMSCYDHGLIKLLSAVSSNEVMCRRIIRRKYRDHVRKEHNGR